MSIKSMTGFGKALCELPGKNVVIEMKSLNSRQFDLSLRIPMPYREKEPELRAELARRLVRGKVEVTMYIEYTSAARQQALNRRAIVAYYRELKSIADEVGADPAGLMGIVMHMPDVTGSETDSPDGNEWFQVMNAVKNAVNRLNEFRSSEGKIIGEDFTNRILSIQRLLNSMEGLERGRINTVKERIAGQLQQVAGRDNIDANRFEQELIYYLERLDISEEKTRLKTHCNYFIETLRSGESNGKKLNFISQEIGREVNTIGSKANDAGIQKIVVQMKEDLEKIKEQLANVL